MADKLYKPYLDMWLKREHVELPSISVSKASSEARKVWANSKNDARENDIAFDKVWTEVLGDAHKLRAITMTNITDSSFLETIRPRSLK